MSMVFPFIIWFLVLISIAYFSFLYFFHLKIDLLWKKIYYLFQKRIQLISSLYEVSKHDIIKSDEIFTEIIELSLQNFWKYSENKNFIKHMYLQQKIHKELDFIFRVSMKHPKLIKNYKFYYIKEEIFSTTWKISENIELYKNMSQKFNFFQKCKFLTLIWIIIPIQKKEEI